jgi:hypothetical protein
VDPTPDVIATVDVRDTRIVSIYVKNLDGAQTLSVTIQTRGTLDADFSERLVFDELTAIPAGKARTIDFDCGTQSELQLTGIASGAGLLADVTIKPDGGRR